MFVSFHGCFLTLGCALLMKNILHLGLDRIVERLGNTQFSDEFLLFLNNILLVEHFSLVQLGTNEARFITSANVNGITISKSLQKMYLTRYFKKDPNIQFHKSAMNSKEVLVNRLIPRDIEDASYQQFFGYDIKIVDRISLLKDGDRGLYCLNIYRFSIPFSQTDVDELNHAASLLMSCAIKHSRLAGGLSDFLTREAKIEELELRLQALKSKLTSRELAVCARILLGLSGEGIALDLGIKVTSVQTYRKRAYTKLNISSMNELFGLCLRNE
jgi:DNA-binding CsgD family transcriptional regulator